MAQMKRSDVVRVGPHRLPTADLIVVLGMVLAAVALGVGIHFQIGLPAGGAAVVALTVEVALLAVHALVRRSGLRLAWSHLSVPFAELSHSLLFFCGALV